MRAVFALSAILLLAACEKSALPQRDATGSGLERAAVVAGVVASADDPVGLYASDTDRLCLVARSGGGYRIGATIDYGPDHRCSAAGMATGRSKLQVRLSDTCRFVAQFDGERVVFPAVLPAACDLACTGRATLAALETDRLSSSPAEAATMRDAAGRTPCAS